MPNTDHQSYLTTTGEKLVYFACRISKVPPKAMGIILNGHGERISGISSYHRYQQLSWPITGRYTLQISRFTRRGEGKAILVLETVTFLLASIYRGFLARMRSHHRLVNPPCRGLPPR